jgi:hypothetical protein
VLTTQLPLSVKRNNERKGKYYAENRENVAMEWTSRKSRTTAYEDVTLSELT